MKIVTIESARAGLIMNPEEILPLRGVDPRDMCDLIAERYDFAVEPDFSEGPKSIRDKTGLIFEVGKLKTGSQGFITKLIVTVDNIVAWASHTDIAKEFMEDLLDWGTHSQGWRVAPTLLADNLVFLSQITVEFENSMGRLIRNLETLSGMFQDVFNKSYGCENKIDFAGLDFNYDRTYLAPPLNQLASFGMERKFGAAFDTNRFFCTAPIETENHIKLLEQIERIAAE